MLSASHGGPAIAPQCRGQRRSGREAALTGTSQTSSLAVRSPSLPLENPTGSRAIAERKVTPAARPAPALQQRGTGSLTCGLTHVWSPRGGRAGSVGGNPRSACCLGG